MLNQNNVYLTQVVKSSSLPSNFKIIREDDGAKLSKKDNNSPHPKDQMNRRILSLAKTVRFSEAEIPEQQIPITHLKKTT